MNRWQFVLHQQALEEIDELRPVERRQVHALLLRLVEDPWQAPDSQIRPTNDPAYFVMMLRRLRVIYWLDAFAREICVVGWSGFENSRAR